MIRKITQAAVIGAGIMGGGIAALLSGAGIRTLLLDIVPPDLTPAEKEDLTARNRIAKAGLDAALLAKPPLFMSWSDTERIRIGNTEDDFQRLAACDWIIEVVVEDLKVKHTVLERIQKVRKPTAVVSTNTSGIPLKEMSSDLTPEFRRHFLGTHFFNPVRYMKLLEIVPGPETLPEIVDFMEDFCERILGKGVVRAKDTPNFIGNRIGVHGLMTAIHRMQSAGLTITEVDALFGPMMGRPKTALFRLADMVGLDTLGHITRNTYAAVPDDEDREMFVLPGFVEEMIAARLLGSKTQAGFYKAETTPEMKKEYKVIDPASLTYGPPAAPDFPCLKAAAAAPTLAEKMRALVYGDDPGARYAWQVTAQSLIYAANRIPEIADTVVDIDNAMRWGFNFDLGAV